MQRAESPAPSLQSQDAASTKSAGHKAAYRLFPSVEPTPAASPASFQRASLHKAATEFRKRSSSLDPARERWALLSRAGARPAQTFGQGGKASVSEMKPIQEQPTLDSPLFPSRCTYPPAETPKADDSGHGRSSSASTANKELPSEPNMSPVWQSRVAASSTQTLHGLGLTLPSDAPPEVAHVTRKRMKARPNLRVDIRRSNKNDKPPPPPPKSPRHERKTSDASQASSVDSATSLKTTHTFAPISTAQSMAYQPARPMFVHAASSSRSSPTVPAVPALPFRSAEQRIEDVLNSPDTEHGPPIKKIILRKAVGQGNTRSAPAEEVGARLPSSKFSSITAPGGVLSAEGERTPKAIQSSLTDPSQATQTQLFNIQERQLPVRSPTVDEEADLQTPRKDSLMQRKSADPPEAQLPKPGKHFEDPQPPPTPSKDAHFMPTSPRLPTSPKPSATATLGSPLFDVTKRPASPRSRFASSTTRPPTRDAPKPPGQSEAALRSLVVDKGPTPELPSRASTPALDGGRVDPSAELSNLTKQTEALHKRYATLRSDRQILQTSIVASLKEHKAGPEYANTLLDQHLQLTAINSSMDICFAKMKSLECKKEEAMAAIIAQHKAQFKADTMFKKRESDNVRSMGSPKSDRSGRRTPDVRLDIRGSAQQRSSSKLRTASPLPKPDRGDSEPLPASASQDTKTEKRNTVIRTSGPPTESVVGKDLTAEPDEISKATEGVDGEPKKLRIKGAKAAKLLDMMREAADSEPGTGGVGVPDELVTDTLTAAANQQPLIEVHIPTSPLTVLPPLLPMLTANKTLPTPPPSAKHGADSGLHHRSMPSDASTTSTASSASSSRADAAESSTATTSRASSESNSPLEQYEAETPKDKAREIIDKFASQRQQRKARKPTRGKSVQTIQVYVDDGILEDYEQDKILDYYGAASPERTLRRHG